ncbi:MAG TPA: hypothetical protein VN132_10420 [Bdellovibrio sp.]|nr:hypothetical protein [Bdellovibrio sp.]
MACSPAAVDDSSGIDSYVVASGSFDTANATKISGLGNIRFVNVLNGIFSNNSMALKAQLDLSGNSVTAIFNSNNSVMNSSAGGVAVTFTRSGASVIGSIAVNGSSVTMDPSRLSFYVPAALDVIIDVHNISSTRAHVLIWRRDSTIYSAGSADIDTDNSTDYSGTYPTNAAGAGTFAGLSLNNATVTGSSIGLAKVAE